MFWTIGCRPRTSRPQRLHAAMRYAVLGGGKRLRPLLIYATGETLGVPPSGWTARRRRWKSSTPIP